MSIIITALLMRLKGYGLGYGKILSALGFSGLCYFLHPEWISLLGGLGWFLGNKPSLGEIEGAIGGYKGNWRDEGREWGWKQGLQRGVFTGACISVFTWNPAFIVSGSLFPVCTWIGISINQWLKGKVQVSWYLFELLFGAVLGAAFYVQQ